MRDDNEQKDNVIEDVLFSPDGESIAITSKEGDIKIFNIVTGNLKKLKGHEGRIYSISFSWDNTQIASASADGTVRVWRVSDSKELRRFIHNKNVKAVTFSKDHKTLVSAGDDGVIRIWDITPRTQVENQVIKWLDLTCNYLHNYLKNNSSLVPKDRIICYGVNQGKNQKYK